MPTADQTSVTLRHRLFVQLYVAAWPGQGLSPLNRIIACAIILSVTLAVLETEPVLMDRFREAFTILDYLFGLIFLIEYAVRIWVVAESERYSGFVGRLRYATSPVALIDLLAILPFLLTLGVGDAFILRLVRLLRLVTIAKLGRYSTALQNICTAIKDRRYELLMSLAAAFIVMLVSAMVLHLTEGSQNPESFGSIPRALWWGAATVTKIGYGGAFPVTVMGKFFAVLFAIAAVGVIAMPTGILAAAFSEAFQRDQRRLDAEKDG